MEYTLNEEQIKFLEAILGGMSNKALEKYIKERYDEEEAEGFLSLIENDEHVKLYRDLYDLIYDRN